MEQVLGSWTDGGTKEAIMTFVRSVTEEGASFVPPEERVATFDNDGTLWCEKPMPIEAGGRGQDPAAQEGDAAHLAPDVRVAVLLRQPRPALRDVPDRARHARLTLQVYDQCMERRRVD